MARKMPAIAMQCAESAPPPPQIAAINSHPGERCKMFEKFWIRKLQPRAEL